MTRFTKKQKEKYLKEYEELMQKKYGGIAQTKLEQAKEIIRELLGCLQQDTNDPETNYYVVKYIEKAEAFLKE